VIHLRRLGKTKGINTVAIASGQKVQDPAEVEYIGFWRYVGTLSFTYGSRNVSQMAKFRWVQSDRFKHGKFKN
jgi:hypothetical protein